MKGKGTDLNSYLNSLPAARRGAIEALSAVILDAIPGSTQAFRYGMPAFDIPEGSLCCLASQKNDLALYMEPRVTEQHQDALAHLNCGKSCVRFKTLDQLPLDTVRQMLREVAELRRAS